MGSWESELRGEGGITPGDLSNTWANFFAQQYYDTFLRHDDNLLLYQKIRSPPVVFKSSGDETGGEPTSGDFSNT